MGVKLAFGGVDLGRVAVSRSGPPGRAGIPRGVDTLVGF